MRHKPTQRGQALILIVLTIVGLVALVALAVDGGNAFADRRHAQNAADAAALAAALAKINDQDWQTAAMGRAISNGYNNDGIHSTVTVSNPPGAGCNGVNSPYAGNDEYVQVVIRSTVDTFFGSVVGINQMNNCVEAVARAREGAYVPLYNGAGVVALKPNGNSVFGNVGNINLTVRNSGVFVNSNGSCAMSVNGNVNLTVDTQYGIVGGFCRTGNVTVHGPVVTGSGQVPYPPSINVPPPSISCSGEGYRSGNTYYPGHYSNISLSANGSYTFAPGNYCVDNGISISGNIALTMNNVNMQLNGGSFAIAGNSSVSCSNFLFYSTGNAGGIHFNGNSGNTCTGATFYLESGNLVWNGNVANTFTARTEGPYANLLIYMPYGNTSGLTINGNSGNTIVGTVLAVQSPITISGNSGTAGFRSQIVGYTIQFSGNANTTIDYRDSDNFDIPSPPTIELVR